MDEQAVVGADRFRSLLLRAVVLIGGVLAGTALAWLLSSATASAAEPAPVSTLLSAAGDVVDNSVAHTVHIGRTRGWRRRRYRRPRPRCRPSRSRCRTWSPR
ncbi:hypothetical protein [Kutzneria kofuensis]|uniref:hypothetical protein n=1 Tax=Kutzneria kofuensis TaxID=103725 RepID=UPI0031E6FCEC